MNPRCWSRWLCCALGAVVVLTNPLGALAQDDGGNNGDDNAADIGDAVVDPGEQGETTFQEEQLGLGWTKGWYLSPPGFGREPSPTPTPPPATCGDGVCQDDDTCHEDPTTCPADCGFCGDGTCRDPENASTCAKDCSVCGDNVCSEGETNGSCANDCPVCGDDICNPLCENLENCPADCSECGDGTCSANETKTSCPQDCNVCGDGVCGTGEKCPKDCATCGDGTCNGDETLATCPGDCTRCGDGVCSVGETPQTCANDCVVPTPTPTATATPTPQPTPPILNCPPGKPLNCNAKLNFCACGRCAEDPFHKECLGCFSPETSIAMADGTSKAIVNIKPGDLVLNPVTKKGVRVKYPTMGPEAIPMWKIGFGTAAVVVTEGHPMVVSNGNQESEWTALSGLFLRSGLRNAPKVKQPESFDIRQARNLKVGDLVLAADGEYHAVNLVQQLPVAKDQVVINLMLDVDSAEMRDHMLLADGVVTGDLYLQERLEKK